MAPYPAPEAEPVAHARRIYLRTLRLWASDYLLCRSLGRGSAGGRTPPWQVRPLLERAGEQSD